MYRFNGNLNKQLFFLYKDVSFIQSFLYPVPLFSEGLVVWSTGKRLEQKCC